MAPDTFHLIPRSSTMERVWQEQRKLSKEGNLSKSVNDIQKTINLLLSARSSVASGEIHASVGSIELFLLTTI